MKWYLTYQYSLPFHNPRLKTSKKPMKPLSLQSGSTSLVLDPENGGSILRYTSETDEGTIEWMRPAGKKGLKGDILDLSCFPLIPFSSRIRDGCFRFNDQEFRLPLNFSPEKHTIHGHGWKAPWQVMEQSATKTQLQYDHQPGEWPWSYRALQFYELEEEKLSIRLELQNTSNSAMPVGMGLHPYFVRTPRARVKAACDRMWVNDEEVMPMRLDPLPPDRNIRKGLEVESGFIDNTFTGWERRAMIEWPEWNAGLVIESEAPLDFLVVYAPLKEDFFCVEPVSNVTDAFNMMARGETGHGTRVLQPGESWGSGIIFLPEFGS